MTVAERVERAVDALRRGGCVVLTGGDRQDETGTLALSAQRAGPESVAFLLRHTSGVIYAALTAARLEALDLRQMIADGESAQGAAFTVSVDARAGVTTGISAADRAATLAALADPASGADAFRRPGHVFPVRVDDRGVLAKRGRAEASIDLAALAGHPEVVALGDVVTPDHAAMADLEQVRELTEEHDLPVVSVEDLLEYRLARESTATSAVAVQLPTPHGEFLCEAWTSQPGAVEHVTFSCGDIRAAEPVLVHIHRACLAGDVFRSSQCSCRPELEGALRDIGDAGRGVLVYLRTATESTAELADWLHDGAGTCGRAEPEQVGPTSQVVRDYAAAAGILAALEVDAAWLTSDDAARVDWLGRFGVRIVGSGSRPTPA